MLLSLFSRVLTFVVVLERCRGISSETADEPNKFSLIRNKSFFVDKTLLLKSIFQHDFQLITAPTKFCKSTNLQMIKLFLGNSNKKSDVADVFRNTNIWEDRIFIVQHLCNYPIIFCNFKTNVTLKTYEDVVQELKIAVSDAFKEHKYLLQSHNISEGTKNRYLQYCRLQVKDFEIGLKFLSKVLHLYHGKRVTVLIDDFDYPMTSSIFKKGLDSSKTAALLFRLIDNSINLNEYVSKCVVVGRLPFKLGSQFSGLYLLEHFKFMSTKDFTPFFGFTQRETENLLDKFQLGRFKQNVSDWYGGYCYLSSDFHIYNPWSVLMFLKTKKLDIHWVPPSSRKILYDYIEPQYELKEWLTNLVKGVPATIEAVKTLTSYEIDKLKNVQFASYSFGENNTEDHLFLQILLESGYFTFAGKYKLLPISTKLKIPNLEIKKVFTQILAKAAATHYDITRPSIRDARQPLHKEKKFASKEKTHQNELWIPITVKYERSAKKRGFYKNNFGYQGTRGWGNSYRGSKSWASSYQGTRSWGSSYQGPRRWGNSYQGTRSWGSSYRGSKSWRNSYRGTGSWGSSYQGTRNWRSPYRTPKKY